ncbi:MAG: hypothetical protein ABSF99_07475 [Anaerolineales bacterium]|jgi:hypothetical protein
MKPTLIAALLFLVFLGPCVHPTVTPAPPATTLPTSISSPTIIPNPAHNTEPRWNDGYYFPRFPKPQQIYAIRVETGLENWWGNPNQPDWRVNQSEDVMAALTLVSMQGIINRSDPAVYLDWQDAGKLGNAAHFWLTPLANYVDVVSLDEEGTSAVEFLWQHFYPRFKGAVIYDPDVPDTINLATMLAGLEDRLMLAPDQLNLPVIRTILTALEASCPADSNPLNLPSLPGYSCTTDLRVLASQQGWREPSDDRNTLLQKRYQIYQWVYDHLWARLEKRAIGMISPGPPASGWIHENQTIYDPLGLAWRDYLIALRLPALWLSTVDEPESTLLERFLDDSPAPVQLLSFYDGIEGGSVALVSRHGGWVPVISNSNAPLSTGNLTVLSAIDVTVEPYQPKIDNDQLFAALGNQPLVTVWSSDGDALQYIMDRGFYYDNAEAFSWENLRGNTFGFTINPTLANLSPLAWNYYVKTAGKTSFVSGFSGAGYTYPALMSDSQLEKYLDYTARYMQLTGLRTLSVDESAGRFVERLGGQYYRKLKPVGYLGAFSILRGSAIYSYPGVPAPLVRAAYYLNYGIGNEILQNLFGGGPGSIFLDFPTSSDAAFVDGTAISDPSASGSQAVRFSRPDQSNCCMVIAGPRMNLAPGTYTATYRLKVTENQSGLPFAHLMLLQQVGAGRNLVDRTIAPSDFTQIGEWQEFSISVTLDEFVNDVQIWLDFMGGTPGYANADLYADTISLTRAGGPGLPIVAPIFMQAAPNLSEDLRLVTEEFERRGGVLLTPDEMMAALNPEYMIGWAAPMLGSNNPALAEAHTLLEEGKFLESLYAVREALRAFPERSYAFDDSTSVEANAWVTDMQADQRAGSLVFRTHASPLAEIHLRLRFPLDLLGAEPKVTADSVSIPVTMTSDGANQLVEFTLPGGPHEIQVVKH